MDPKKNKGTKPTAPDSTATPDGTGTSGSGSPQRSIRTRAEVLAFAAVGRARQYPDSAGYPASQLQNDEGASRGRFHSTQGLPTSELSMPRSSGRYLRHRDEASRLRSEAAVERERDRQLAEQILREDIANRRRLGNNQRSSTATSGQPGQHSSGFAREPAPEVLDRFYTQEDLTARNQAETDAETAAQLQQEDTQEEVDSDATVTDDSRDYTEYKNDLEDKTQKLAQDQTTSSAKNKAASKSKHAPIKQRGAIPIIDGVDLDNATVGIKDRSKLIIRFRTKMPDRKNPGKFYPGETAEYAYKKPINFDNKSSVKELNEWRKQILKRARFRVQDQPAPFWLQQETDILLEYIKKGFKRKRQGRKMDWKLIVNEFNQHMAGVKQSAGARLQPWAVRRDKHKVPKSLKQGRTAPLRSQGSVFNELPKWPEYQKLKEAAGVTGDEQDQADAEDSDDTSSSSDESSSSESSDSEDEDGDAKMN